MHRRWPVRAFALIVALVAFVVALPALAQGEWKKLAERTVNGRFDKDVIQVGSDDGTFTSIWLKVDGSALEMFDVKVVFGNGTEFEPKTRFIFGKDTNTGVIDLPGDK